jgi:hypothetical protein
MSKIRHFALIAVLAALALPTTVRPADDAPATLTTAPSAVTEPARQSGRELAGHVFMPALGLVMPFTTTSFGTYLTMGAGSTTGSVTLQLPGTPPPAPQTIDGTVSYAAIGGVFGYEVEVVRGVSARVKLSETLYSGITGAAVAVVGTNVRLGAGLGVTAGMALGDSVRVAAVFDASYTPRMGLLLGPAIKAAYESCQAGVSSCTFDVSQLFQQKNVLQLEPGVAASWVPLRSLGVTGNLTWVHASLDRGAGGTTSQEGVSVGAAVDFDFKEVSPVALGLQLTWNSLVPVSGGTDSRFTDVGGGIFYTGRKDLSLGLQLISRRFRVAPSVDVSWSTFVATIGLRYYW